MTYIAYNNN